MLGFKQKGGKTGTDKDFEALKKEVKEVMEEIARNIQQMSPEERAELQKGMLEILTKDPDLREKPNTSEETLKQLAEDRHPDEEAQKDFEALKKEVKEVMEEIARNIQQMSPEERAELHEMILELFSKDFEAKTKK